MHISKHSLFRLKITVGCLTSTYPSIHVETPSRSRSVARCTHFQAFTFLLTKTLSRSRSVVWCVGVVCCVVCCVLCWCWCLVVVVLCVVCLCVSVCVCLCVCEQGGKQKYQPKVLLKISSRHGLWLRR